MFAPTARQLDKLAQETTGLLVAWAHRQDLIGAPVPEAAPVLGTPEYQGRPTAYCQKVLGITFWDKIGAIMEACPQPPFRTNVRSGHKIGKTHFLAALINYWFDCYDPGIVITSGASWDAMCDTVWSEVRMQRSRAGRPDFWIGPVAPWLRR